MLLFICTQSNCDQHHHHRRFHPTIFPFQLWRIAHVRNVTPPSLSHTHWSTHTSHTSIEHNVANKHESRPSFSIAIVPHAPRFCCVGWRRRRFSDIARACPQKNIHTRINFNNERPHQSSRSAHNDNKVLLQESSKPAY